MREKKRDFAVKEREITLINLKIDSVFLWLQSGMFTRVIRVIKGYYQGYQGYHQGYQG